MVKHNLVHAEDIHWAIKTLKETYAHPGIVIDRAQQDAANNFDTHWNEIKEFAEKQHVCLEPTRVSKRKPNRPNDKNTEYFIESTLGKDGLIGLPSDTNALEFWKINIYYPVIDNIVTNMKDRFESLPLA